MFSYTNGNYNVTVLEDGTKIRESSDSFLKPEYPESIDLKITNMCDLMCPWCHEKSTPSGKHADIDTLLDRLRNMPAGSEIAIGGGNPLEHPYLPYLLQSLKNVGLISNITVNASHIPKYRYILDDMILNKDIYGLGISWNDCYIFDSPNTVYHVIAGVHDFNTIKNMLQHERKVLILGYKFFGHGKKYYNDNIKYNIDYLHDNLWKIIGKGIISFDNLAIEQLDVKSHFTEEGWKKFYMGDDGKFSMYYDAVKDEFAKSSISTRIKADNTAVNFFRRIQS